MSSETPQDQEHKDEEEKTFAQRVEDSVNFIVDMMNEGKADPKDVYPPNRYHGD